MRFRMISTGAAALLLAGAVNLSATTTSPHNSTLFPAVEATTLVQEAQAQQPPATNPQVDLNITTTREVWYTNPIWIGAGIVALLVIVLAIAAGRGSSGTPSTTTVVK
jgi:hypothetical protein